MQPHAHPDLALEKGLPVNIETARGLRERVLAFIRRCDELHLAGDPGLTWQKRAKALADAEDQAVSS